MLGFQNLHQIFFNISQISSAVSHTYVRFTCNSVKKKPEIDVSCCDHSMNTMETLQESDHMKILKNLPKDIFFSNPENVQQFFRKDINFHFNSKNSVIKSDFQISLKKNDLKNLYALSKIYMIELIKYQSCIHGEESEKKKLLRNCESLFYEKTRWKEHYISYESFEKNKQYGSFNNLTTNNLLFKNFYRTHNSNLIVQKRGFKTKRVLTEEQKPENITIVRLLQKFRTVAHRYQDVKYGYKYNGIMKEMQVDDNTPYLQRLKIKAAFARGYEAARYEPGKVFTFLRVLSTFLLMILLISILLGGEFPPSKKTIWSKLGRYEETDPERVGVTFADVKGAEGVKEELMEIVEFLRNPKKFSTLGGKLPKGILLVGPPGTGKTLLARAMAGEAKVPFFQANGSEFDELFVGEGARRVRGLFRSAKARSPSVIFIDEIDSIGKMRKSGTLQPFANQTINMLLSEMDGFNRNEGIIVIGATNRLEDLDPALLRRGRFDVHVQVPIPDLNERKEILEYYMSKILCKDIDISEMAREATAGCTGADIEAMVNHAALRAATEGATHITMEYLERARDKILIGPELKVEINFEDALLTAYHEGGHAIVAYFTEHAGSLDKITIVPRGQALGHTVSVPEESRHITKASLMARMDILMGGRAGEELIFGVDKITGNCSSDLEKATQLATVMVKNYGMSEKIGVRTFPDPNEPYATSEYGQTVKDQIDNEVKMLLQESYERSKNLLKKHEKEHKLLAEALVKYKTLHRQDIKAILGDSSAEKEPTFSTLK